MKKKKEEEGGGGRREERREVEKVIAAAVPHRTAHTIVNQNNKTWLVNRITRFIR